jgi:signal transduction histidine kinase
MDAAPFYAMIIDETHHIIAWNTALEKSHGADDLCGAYCPHRVHGVSGVYPGCPLEHAAETQQSSECIIYDEPSQKWVRSGAYPTGLCSKDGQRLFLHLTHDITDEHYAQEQLQQSLEHHEALGHLLVRLQSAECEADVLATVFDLTLDLSWMAPACGAAGFLQRGQFLELVTSRNIPESTGRACARVALGQCVCGTVAQTRQPILSHSHARALPLVGEATETAHGHAALPLVHEDSSLGVVNFYLPKDVSLNSHQRRYLESATHVAAAAIAVLQSRAAAREAAERVSSLERGLLERVMQSQEQERRRLARELHDDLGQALSAMAMDVTRAAKEGLTGEALADLVHEGVLRLARQVHELAWDLRPSVLDDFGLDSALSRHVREMAERSGLAIDYLYQCPPGLPERLDASLELVVYRLVQEALNNVVRHANAASASVVLYRTKDQVTLVIEDDGRGFDELARGAPDALGGLGLIGLRERVSLQGGDLVIESTTGSGTSVRARLPLA